MWITMVEIDFRNLEDKVWWTNETYCDNKFAISIAHDPVQHNKTKYVKVSRHFIKEKLDHGLICTPYASSQGNLTDLLTKGLNNNNYERIVSKLGMIDIHPPS